RDCDEADGPGVSFRRCREGHRSMHHRPGKRVLLYRALLVAAVAGSFMALGTTTRAATDLTQMPFTGATPWNTRLRPLTTYGHTRCDSSLQDSSVTPWINASSYSIPVFQAAVTDPVLHVFVGGGYWGDIRVPSTASPAAGTDKHLVMIEPDRRHS